MGDDSIVLFPGLTIDRQSRQGTVCIRSGWGPTRGAVELDPENAPGVLRLLLGLRGPENRASMVARTAELLEMDESDATELIGFLEENKVLIPADTAVVFQDLVGQWTDRGWTEAAQFQIATFGQPFVPDNSGKAVGYQDDYAAMLADTSVMPQPPDRRPLPDGILLSRPAPEIVELPQQPFAELLNKIKTVYAFGSTGISLDLAQRILFATFGNQSYVSTGLGSVPMRSYPSGGARHPLEVYLVNKNADLGKCGTYYLDPHDGALHLIDTKHYEEIDDACFKKRGVQSADLVVIVTCRWLRHIWKYRYPRSYRMIHMELGHSLQSLTFAASAFDVESYYCPSFHDSTVARMCRLGDPLEESPVAVMALGRDGITVEDYHATYDTGDTRYV